MKTYYVEELDANVYWVEDVEDYRAVYDLLNGPETLSVDTETTGLDIYTPDFRVRLCQLGSASEAYVWSVDAHPALTRAVVSTRQVWYHNASFDLLALDRCGLAKLEETVRHALDTGILARLMDPRPREHGGIGHELKELASYHLKLDVKDSRDWVIEEGKRLGILKDDVWRDIPIDNDVYVKYSGSDTILTTRLAAMLRNDIKTVGLEQWATDEHRLAAMLMYVQRKGWAVDREYAQQAFDGFERAFLAAEKQIAEYGIPTTPSGYYYSSAKALRLKLEELGVKFTRFTKKKQDPSLDEAGVEDIIARYPNTEAAKLAALILEASQNQKNAHTFMAGILKYSEYDGRVHASINPSGARTGRMSSSRPNSQNYPRKHAEIRGSYVAEAGEVLISLDFSGLEFRMAAVVTRDQQMREDFMNGLDPHWTIARMAYGKDATADHRQGVKSVGLGRLYGGGRQKLADQSGLSLAKVDEILQFIDQRYPNIDILRQRFYDVIDGPTVIKTVTGKRVVAGSAHLALNYVIQGPGRDMLAQAILRLFDAGYGGMLRGVIHDELVLSVPAANADEWLETIRGIMECTFEGVHMKADGNVLGERWRKA